MATNINHLEGFEIFTKKYYINKEDVCLIGSSALSYHGLRINSDIDFCIKEGCIKNLIDKIKTNKEPNEHIDLILSKKYMRFFGISDDEIISNNKYHNRINDFKVIKLELEFAAKLIMKREKDKADIQKIISFASKFEKWDWTLVYDPKGYSVKLHEIRSFKDIKVKLRDGKQFLKSIYTKYRKPYRNIVKKVTYSNIAFQDSCLYYQTNSLLIRQFLKSKFNRYDIIVRYLAIEESFGQNNYGWDLYEKMQKARKGNPKSKEIFSKLISDFNDGYSSNFPVYIDSAANLIDGSHRIALSLYNKINFIPAQVIQRKKIADYSLNWLSNNSFSKKELALIKEKALQIFVDHGVLFPVIIWPPAQEYFNIIQNDISSKYKILKQLDLNQTDQEFIHFCRKIYSIDDIEDWKIERKIGFMNSYKKKTKVLWILIKEMDFRQKGNTGNEISQTIEKFKKYYRKKYMDFVPNYVYDILFHTGDNYEHNTKISAIINSYNE